jgi:6-phosphogluconolactonase
MKYSFYVANNQSAESCLNRITFDSESKNGEVQLCDKLPQGVQFIAHNSVDKKVYAVIGSEKEDECILITYDYYQTKIHQIYQRRIKVHSASYIYIDPTMRKAYLSDYLGSQFALIELDFKGIPKKGIQYFKLEGSGPVLERQEKSHPHSILIYKNNILFVPDLGSDCIWQILLEKDDSIGRTIENHVIPGSGPRHLCIANKQRIIYVINELTSMINVYDFLNEEESLKLKQAISTLPIDYTGIRCASDIKLNSSGNKLYAGNRGYNSIVEYLVNPQNGKLTVNRHINCGGWPRLFTITEDEKYIIVLIEEYLESKGAIEVYDLSHPKQCVWKNTMPFAYAMTAVQ